MASMTTAQMDQTLAALGDAQAARLKSKRHKTHDDTPALYARAERRLVHSRLAPTMVAYALDESFLNGDHDGADHLRWLLAAPTTTIAAWVEECQEAAR